MSSLARFEPYAYAVLRIVSGAMFAFHGIQKVTGFLGKTMPVGSQLWIGGVIELVAGVLIAIGLFTRPAALIASGTMAVAYIQFHWKLSFAEYQWLPAINQGELAVLYCFVFLAIALRGPVACSIDRTAR
ncbi:MAG TPA: DoxX family protein [Kofleriaceae bacterium]|nr:DoxX family protein [Kofleriaceae bacterium]